MKREIIGAKRHSRVPSPGAAGRDSSSASGASKRANLSATDRDRRALAIDVIWSDIKTVEADVLLVGHYLGVLPQTAELELDQLVSGRSVSGDGKLIITELTRRGAVRGELGEIVLFPGPNGRVVALGGMGRLGTFRAPQVRVLARAVAQVIGLLPAHKTLATVLIGSGKGNLKVKEATLPFLEGLTEAFSADSELKLDRLKFVERELDRALEILFAVKESAAQINAESKGRSGIVLTPSAKLIDGSGGKIPVDFGCSMMLAALARASGESDRSGVGNVLDALLAQLPEELRATVRKRLRELHGKGGAEERLLRDVAMNFRLREPDDDASVNDVPSRVAFWRSENNIHTAAITHSTTVTERIHKRRAPIVENACESLQNPDPDGLPEHAAKLSRLLVLSDLTDVLKRSEPLIVEVDRPLARVQWELLPAGIDGEPLGVARPVARQLRTVYSPRPVELETRQRLKALIIGDPGGPGMSLPAAREEAIAVAKVLKSHHVDTQLLVGAPEEGTGAGWNNNPPADYFEVISLLLSGEYDIVHFSGHATFNSEAADQTGWVFKAGVLTAHELDGMERPPRLVVANACLSAQVSQQNVGSNPLCRTPRDLVASLADEFFKRGVSDYIGAAWEIPSDPAKTFAEEFYKALLVPGGRIGPAVRKARAALYESRQDWLAAWAAYQHYGDPTRSIVSMVAQPPNG